MNSKDTTLSKGKRAEEISAHFLEKNGLKILDRNYHCRGGEIDLICKEKQTFVFVEVRLRQSLAYGGAGESIDLPKQRKIILAATHYLQQHHLWDKSCRFDCILLDKEDEGRIEWIKNAFSTD